MAQRHSFEPPYYFRPDYVEMQLSNLAYLHYSYLFRGALPQAVHASDPAPFILISRTITAGFSVATMSSERKSRTDRRFLLTRK